MFESTDFNNIKDAVEHIKKILAELEAASTVEFQVIHSITGSECSEEGGDWNAVGEFLLNYLRDLDAMQGYMVHHGEAWDYLESEEPEEVPIHKPTKKHLYVFAGEGVTILHNPFAIFDEQYPIVVVKQSFWRENKEDIVKLLKDCEPNYDYTCKISPAVYVELFYTSGAE